MQPGDFSLEATRPADGEIALLRDWLKPGTPIFLSSVATQTPRELAKTAVRVRRAGFEPVAHIAARRIASRHDLADLLERACGGAAMRRVLVIGGDSAVQGPFADALSVVATGALREAGIEEVGIADYPEGHPEIPEQLLDGAMTAKLDAARIAGLRPFIVTQFSFSPDAVLGWLRALRARGIVVPVKIGMAGPTKLPALLRYAARCGVKASAQGLVSGAAAALLGHVGPDRILEALRGAGPELGDVAPHYFSFGGLAATARYAAEIARDTGQHAIKFANQR